MTEYHRSNVKYVKGPLGNWLTLADLPPPGTIRWTPCRKAEIVAAVLGGLLSIDEVCKRYHLPWMNSSPGRLPLIAMDLPDRAQHASSNTKTALSAHLTVLQAIEE